MSKKITLDIDIHSSCTILTNENGDTYKFEPYKEDKEDLYEFLLNCGLENIEYKVKAREEAVALRDLLNYSPQLKEDNVYKSMVEMMNHVLVLTNDIDFSRLEDK